MPRTETRVESPRRWRLALLGVVLLAFGLRLWNLISGAELDYHKHLVLDAATYQRIAIQGDPAGPYWQPPLYPWFLRGILLSVGHPSPVAVRLIQAIGGAALVAVIGLIARTIGGVRSGIAAALVAALYGPLIYFDAELLPAAPATLLATLLLWQCLVERPKPWLIGLLLGALGLLLPAFAIAALLLLIDLGRRHGVRSALGAVLVAALCILPVSLRNLEQEPDLVTVSSNGGINLYIGNNADYPRSVSIRPGIEWQHLTERPRCEAAAQTAAAESRFFSREVGRFALSQPLLFLRNLIWKGAAAISVREIGRNRDLYAARSESWPLCLLLQEWGFPFLLLLPAAVAGGAALRRERRLPTPLVLLTIGVLLAGVIFFPTSRYRTPALPALIIMAAAGLPLVRRRDLVPAACALAIGLVPHGIPSIPQAETQYEIAIDLDQDGNSSAAIPFFKRALELAPDSADSHLGLGLALVKIGEEGEARRHLERCLELDPKAEVALQALALQQLRNHDWDKARALFERAVQADPCNHRVRAGFAEALIQAGYLNEARRQIDAAKAVHPKRDRYIEQAERRLR